MRTILSLFLITMLILSSSAQTGNWTSVKALPKGTELVIDRKNDTRITGFLTSVDDNTLALTSDAGAFFVGRDNVRKVYYAVPRNKMKHTSRGALIGGAVGLGVGVFLQNPDSEAMPGAVTLIAGGLLGGWLGSRRGKGKDRGEIIYAIK